MINLPNRTLIRMQPIVVKDFLTPKEESELLEKIDLETWFPNRTGSRRVQIYGPYHNKQYKIIPGKYSKHPPHVKWLAEVTLKKLQELVENGKIDSKLVFPTKWVNDQELEVYINEFLPKSGLRYHFDHRHTYNELICGISLNSDSIISFKKGSEIEEISIPQRSLYLMFGTWRKDWKHGLQPKHVTDKRVSVTFRTVR